MVDNARNRREDRYLIVDAVSPNADVAGVAIWLAYCTSVHFRC